jgi:hypothetical protein
VLERWDYRETTGWQPWLAQAWQAARGHGLASLQRAELEQLLARFTESATYEQLRTARNCYKEVEFLLPLDPDPGPRRSLVGDSRPMVRGVIDCLWQDATNAWHLLAFMLESVPPAARQRYWRSQRLGLVLGAWAVAAQVGAWPASGTLFFLDGCAAITRRGRSLQERKGLEQLAALFSATDQPLSFP